MAQIFIAMLILTYILMIGGIKLNGMTNKLIRLKYRSVLVIRAYLNFYRKLPFCLSVLPKESFLKTVLQRFWNGCVPRYQT